MLGVIQNSAAKSPPGRGAGGMLGRNRHVQERMVVAGASTPRVSKYRDGPSPSGDRDADLLSGDRESAGRARGGRSEGCLGEEWGEGWEASDSVGVRPPGVRIPSGGDFTTGDTDRLAVKYDALLPSQVPVPPALVVLLVPPVPLIVPVPLIIPVPLVVPVPPIPECALPTLPALPTLHPAPPDARGTNPAARPILTHAHHTNLLHCSIIACVGGRDTVCTLPSLSPTPAPALYTLDPATPTLGKNRKCRKHVDISKCPPILHTAKGWKGQQKAKKAKKAKSGVVQRVNVQGRGNSTAGTHPSLCENSHLGMSLTQTQTHERVTDGHGIRLRRRRGAPEKWDRALRLSRRIRNPRGCCRIQIHARAGTARPWKKKGMPRQVLRSRSDGASVPILAWLDNG
ncbi:hypothetical protein K438DRAFT_1955778 [Mycena galopus ATCC 62051]|nr:hypothetical protein K438DRAFT_1955778 [Mycena galopus ATCC 62051]